ncbi:MAG: phosphoribosylamine--glycine ligase [Flavobacteriaceae bacterium]|nr:phosphoribosylamine--glycine ligase [Flavobacteriaceae bacterium]
MKILIIGAGGREHAIGWKLKQDNAGLELFFSIGNAGTATLGENLGLTEISDLIDFAQKHEIDLTIVGPEAELVDGIVDKFSDAGLKIFGPNQMAAQLEGSKVFAKEFMRKYGVKTADYNSFRHYVDARDFLDSYEHFPVVIKASGLAAGKGVVIANDLFEAQKAVREMMHDNAFGDAGKQVVIEQFLSGFECSILSIYNGKEIVPFISAKDHKKIGEGETGLNTGGMGVVAPNPQFTAENRNEFVEKILKTTQDGLQKESLNFAGIIFFGLMVTQDGVYLLEYNTRFGDPETQAILPLMENNLLQVIIHATEGKSIQLHWKNQHACCVVMASGGYPLNYDKGFVINGLERVETPVFLAGVQKANDQFLSSGGRVLSVVGIGDTLASARELAYDNLKKITFDYAYYRKDIGNNI